MSADATYRDGAEPGEVTNCLCRVVMDELKSKAYSREFTKL
jgi:hypothetical protein